MGCPAEVEIGDNLVFSVITHTPATGAITDADAVPAYRIYEDETDPPILTGNMAKLDDDDTTGFYTESIAATSGNGFENGKSYNIYITAAVGGVTGGVSYAFKAYDARKSDLTYILAHLLTDTGTQLADAFQKFFDVGTPTGTVNSLPGAAPDGAGGLPISDAGGLDMDNLKAELDGLQGTDGKAAISTDAQDLSATLDVNTKLIEGADPTDTIRDSVVDDATRIDASDLNTHSAITAAAIVNEWETQSQADPTGFHVNTREWLDQPVTLSTGNKPDVNVNEVSDDATAADDLELLVENSKGTDHKVLVSTDAQDLSGTLDVNTKTITAGIIDANAIATDAIDADSLKADAVTEIQSGLATATNVTNAHSTTDGKVDAIQTDLGDFSGRTNDQTLLDVLGVPDVAGKDLYTLLVTDRLDHGTYGLSAIETIVDDLEGRLTAARAGYLDELAAANLPADVDTLLGRLTAARAGYLDELAAANIPADIDTLLGRVTAAVALASVCSEGRLAELDAANIPADVDTLLTRITALIATKAEMDAAHALLATPAQVNTEVSDVIKTDTYTLPGQGAPTATPTLEEALMYLFKQFRNKETQTATEYALYADDTTTKDQKATISDDGTTFTKGEMTTGA